jgi:hypothetical protein
MSDNFFPLVRGETTSNSPNVGSIMDQLEEGRFGRMFGFDAAQGFVRTEYTDISAQCVRKNSTTVTSATYRVITFGRTRCLAKPHGETTG